MSAVLLLLGLAAAHFDPPPATEITLWSLAYGVDPYLAQAVTYCESGAHPEPERDRVISRSGDYGRFQVNCQALHLRPCTPLLDRHVNIRTGVALIAAIKSHFAGYPPGTCRCGQPGHHWIAHYNAGMVVTPFSEQYARRVLWKTHRLRRSTSDRRW